MAYIAFASAKGSPGVTTTIAALAATWPENRDLYVAELDPAGGDLAVRFELSPEPGLVGLAAAGRRGLDVDTFLSYTQPLPSGAATDNGGPARKVLVGPVAAEQAQAALSALRVSLPRALDSLGADVLADCGRLDPGSPVEELACQADLLVVVARPVLTEVHHLAARLSLLRPKALSLLVVGEEPYSVRDVAEAVRASPLGNLPIDHRAAAALTVGHPNPAAALRRSRLLRSARLIADGLAQWMEAPSPGSTAPGASSALASAPPVPPRPSPSAPPGAPASGGTAPGPPAPAPATPGTRPAPAAPGPRPAPAGPGPRPTPGESPPSAGEGRPPIPPPPSFGPAEPTPTPSSTPAVTGPPPQTSGRITLPIPPRRPAPIEPPPDLVAPRHFRRNSEGEHD